MTHPPLTTTCSLPRYFNFTLRKLTLLSFVAADYPLLPETMSCMRYLTRSRASLVSRRFLHQPSITHIYQSDDADAKAKSNNSPPSLLRTSSFVPQTRFQNSSKIGLFRSDFVDLPRFCRSMSTANGDSGHSDIADLVSENAVEAVASSAPAAAVNEVAVAAADTFYPVYLVQHFIDAVHSYTGFNWWSSIVIAALLYRGVIVLPLQLHFRYADFLFSRDNLVRIEELRKMNLKVWKAKNWVEMAKIMKEAFTLVWVPSLALTNLAMIHLIFALGILNMAEKVPSFKTGGAFWFLDLSTPDQQLIFPVVVAQLIQIRVCIQEWELNPTILALMSMPFTMCLPKAHLLFLSAYLILHFPARELERYLVKKVVGRISS